MRGSALVGMLASAVILAGCLLSATFVLGVFFKDTDFDENGVRYHKLVDLTNEQEWKDHQDNIHTIDLIGFQIWITNEAASSNSFNLFVDDGEAVTRTTRQGVEDSTTKIINALALPASQKVYLSYSHSLKLLDNEAKVKELAKEGRFHFYAISKNPTIDFVIDSVRVIATITAGN
jgi:hypothetical protein